MSAAGDAGVGAGGLGAKGLFETLIDQQPLRALEPDERRDWLRLARAQGVGPSTFRALLDRFRSASRAIDALPALDGRVGRSGPIRLPDPEAIEDEIAQAANFGARHIALCEPDYPPWLRATDGAPPIIVTAGDLGLAARRPVAIVGSRSASAAGLRIAGDLARGLGEAGCSVVSGLARGIDGAAHRACIETGTVAIVAGGIDVLYPPEHDALFRAIRERGLVIAERHFGAEPRAKDFPRRNRIISGLCPATIVVEAERRSGSLSTARFAAEQGREVFAVPGHPLDPRAAGTLQLLKDGASLCTCADDVLLALEHAWDDLPSPHSSTHDGEGFAEAAPIQAAPEGLPATKREQAPEPSVDIAVLGEERSERPPAYRAVRAALGPMPASIDDLCRATSLAPRDVQAALLELDLAGELERHGQQLVSRRVT